MKVWLLELTALDDSDNATTLYFASGDYTSAAPNYYETRLKQPSLFEVRSEVGSLLPGGRSSAGEVELINLDGGLNYLADYALDGRSAILKLSSDSGVVTIVEAVTERIIFTESTVRLTLRSAFAELDQPVPMNRYAGTNTLPAGVEGTSDDIQGQVKPQVFGSVVNVRPMLVNTAVLIYQVHDGSDCTVSAVRDRGVALTFDDTASDLADLLNNAPSPGEWRRYQGYFSIGAAGEDITCDAQNTSINAGEVFDAVADTLGFTVNSGDVTALNAIGAVGIYLNTERSASDLLTEIAVGVGAYWADDFSGDIRVAALAAPGAVDLTIENWQIIQLDRSAIGSGDNGLPIPAVTVRADRIGAVQTDLAASAANQSRYASEYREATSSDGGVATRHPLGRELFLNSPLRSLTDAASVASGLLALFKVRRDRTVVTCQLGDMDAADLDLGQTVRLNTPRLGYPRDFILLGWRINARRSRLTLDLWG